MKISAKDVKKLRDITGSGMMDCKKALVEAGGDQEKAIEILRKKGQKIMGKRADREANEGVIIAKANENRGIAVKVSSETDFVAKNADFIAMTTKIAEIALANFPASIEELNALPYDDTLTVGQKTLEQAGVIGEKIEVAKYETLESDSVIAYIHGNNRLGVLVGLNQTNDKVTEAGKNIAMQIAAMSPVAVSKNDIPQELIDKELEIAVELTRKENAGKPEELLKKIAMGKLNKWFFKEKALLSQAFVKESKSSVKQYLASVNKDLTVTAFKRVTLS